MATCQCWRRALAAAPLLPQTPSLLQHYPWAGKCISCSNAQEHLSSRSGGKAAAAESWQQRTAVMDGVRVSAAGDSLLLYLWCTFKHHVKYKKPTKDPSAGIKVLSSSSSWTVHLGMLTPERSLQTLGCSCSQDEFSLRAMKRATPVPPPHCLQLPQLPREHLHCCHHQGCSEARQVFPPPSLLGVGRAAASSGHASLCSAVTAVFGQPMVTHTSSWHLECIPSLWNL